MRVSRAPVPWQGIEMEELPQLDASCSCRTDSGLLLDFTCQQLLTGAAGEAALRSVLGEAREEQVAACKALSRELRRVHALERLRISE